jgi:hypothetical protein
LAFRIENCRDRITVTFPNYHNNPALAVLVPSQTPITAMCFDIDGLHVAAGIAAIDLGVFAFPTDDVAQALLAGSTPRFSAAAESSMRSQPGQFDKRQ